MPVFILEESNFAGPIDDDEILPARVVGIKERIKPFKDDDGNEIKRVEFAFVIETPEGSHDGQKLWGDTSTVFSNNPNCKLFAWSQEILGQELPGGYALDTDTLVGQNCRVIVGLRKYEKDGKEQTRNFVKDVVRPAGSNLGSADNVAPF
jgi:hypothetical protein